MRHSNISVFVPHVGCHNMCSFCNQHSISGSKIIPTGDDVREICRKALDEVPDRNNTEIAFFGGSFTAIDRDYMTELLSAASEFVGDGGFSGIRISTRPDRIDEEILATLKNYGVTAIELGAQSMSDEVLSANNRGHTSDDVRKASALIKSYGFELGLQMMVGLYKSTEALEYLTMSEIIALHPDTARIYPTVVIEGTALAELYQSGKYELYDFDKAVGICSGIMYMFEFAGIKVIRVGLHASDEVDGKAIAGFYHPAFRELCEGEIFRKAIDNALSGKRGKYEIGVSRNSVSKAIGQNKRNIAYFASIGKNIKIIPDDRLAGYGISIKEVN